MAWWKKKAITSIGVVQFPGAIPPPVESLRGLDKAGVTLADAPPEEDAHWTKRATHPAWGECVLSCPREARTPPRIVLDHDPRLTSAEKERALLGRTAVVARFESKGSVLRERKKLLRWLHAIGDGEATSVCDVSSQAFWSTASLDEELAHDADLDILALFTVHAITGDDDRAYWLHTHGLAELGRYDFDVVDPAADVSDAWDVIRALAFAVVEGKIDLGGDPLPLVGGVPPAQMVDARTFRAKSGVRHPRWNADVDDGHLEKRAIVCDAAERRLFGLLGPGAPQRWSLFSLATFDDRPLMFSDAASELMAERARATWGVFRAVREELAELELPALVKLRYGDGDKGEHLWFKVDGVGEKQVDATLINEPWGNIGLRKGERRKHDLERMSDWNILSPAGNITPRSLSVARVLRENKDEILAALRERRA